MRFLQGIIRLAEAFRTDNRPSQVHSRVCVDRDYAVPSAQVEPSRKPTKPLKRWKNKAKKVFADKYKGFKHPSTGRAVTTATHASDKVLSQTTEERGTSLDVQLCAKPSLNFENTALSFVHASQESVIVGAPLPPSPQTSSAAASLKSTATPDTAYSDSLKAISQLGLSMDEPVEPDGGALEGGAHGEAGRVDDEIDDGDAVMKDYEGEVGNDFGGEPGDRFVNDDEKEWEDEAEGEGVEAFGEEVVEDSGGSSDAEGGVKVAVEVGEDVGAKAEEEEEQKEGKREIDARAGEEGQEDEAVEKEEEGLNSEDDNEDEKDPNDRRDIEAIRAIPDSAFEKVTRIFAGTRVLLRNTCTVIDRCEGSFHHVVIVEARFSKDVRDEFIIKVPFHGTEAHWRDEDGEALHSEAELMKTIYAKTSVPVPQVIAYDVNVQNELGAPYIFMRKAPGKQAYKLWIEDLDILDTVDFPSPEVARKRTRFLYSLARSMAELQKLQFNGIGMPKFPGIHDDDYGKAPPAIGPAFTWHTTSEIFAPSVRQPSNSTKEFVKSIYEKAYETETKRNHETPEELQGRRKILDIIFSHPVFTTSKASPFDATETFVLRHNDLNLQNIFVDEDGNVTGIIDWDACSTVPRCIGPMAVPVFLRRDWYYGFSLDRMPFLFFSTEFHRQAYAEAMKNVMLGTCGEVGDARLTYKSAMYQAIIDGCLGENWLPDVVDKILTLIPGFRHVDVTEFCGFLGKKERWPQMEEYLKKEIFKVLDPDDYISRKDLSFFCG